MRDDVIAVMLFRTWATCSMQAMKLTNKPSPILETTIEIRAPVSS